MRRESISSVYTNISLRGWATSIRRAYETAQLCLAFRKRAIEPLRQQVEELTDELIGQLAARSRIELISEFAVPLPLAVITDFLELPGLLSIVEGVDLEPSIRMDDLRGRVQLPSNWSAVYPPGFSNGPQGLLLFVRRPAESPTPILPEIRMSFRMLATTRMPRRREATTSRGLLRCGLTG